MLGFFKKQNVAKSPATGNILPIENVEDEVFSSKMMGEGFAISDHNGEIFSPVEGEITSVFPTLHAITIVTKNGQSVLIHMGINTVELKGEPFTIEVETGQRVIAGSLLARMEIDKVHQAGKSSHILVVFLEFQGGTLLRTEGRIEVGEDIFSLK